MDEGLDELRMSGALLPIPSLLAPKAEALYLGNRTAEALTTISEAETLVERTDARWWSAEFYRLRAILLTAMDADEAQIEGAFHEAIRIAKEQKSR